MANGAGTANWVPVWLDRAALCPVVEEQRGQLDRFERAGEEIVDPVIARKNNVAGADYNRPAGGLGEGAVARARTTIPTGRSRLHAEQVRNNGAQQIAATGRGAADHHDLYRAHEKIETREFSLGDAHDHQGDSGEEDGEQLS